MFNDKTKIFLSIAIVIELFAFWLSYNNFKSKELLIKEKEFQIKKETYISALIDQYNRYLQSCFAAAKKSKTLTRDKCIENINNSRVANLLKKWGYSDVLLQKEQR